MQAKRLAGALQDPGSKVWRDARAEHVPLAAAPLADQQSRYIRTSWADRPYGLARDLKAQAAHDGESFYLRLEWSSPTRVARTTGDNPLGNPPEGPDAFPDSVAVMFPANGSARLDTKGSQDAPVTIWRWAESGGGVPDKVESLVAAGLGTLQAAEQVSGLWARSGSDEASWQVVLGRPLAPGADDVAPRLAPGESVQIAFAVWTGANQERAGIKSYSQRWIELELEQ